MVQKRRTIQTGQPDPAQVLSNIVAQPVAPTVRVNIAQPKLQPLADFSNLSDTLQKAIELQGAEEKFAQETEASKFAKQLEAEKRRTALRVGQAKAIEDGLIPAEATETFWNEFQRTAAEMDVAERFIPAIEARNQELISASPEERTKIWNEVWGESVQAGGEANFYYTATANAQYEQLFANKNREYTAAYNAQAKDKAYRDSVWLTAEEIQQNVVPVLNTGDPDAVREGWEGTARFISDKWQGAQLDAKPQEEMLKDVIISMAASLQTGGTPEVQLRQAEQAYALVLDAIDNARIGDDRPGGSGFREAFPEGTPERAALAELANQLDNSIKQKGAAAGAQRALARNEAEQLARNSQLVASLDGMVANMGVAAGDKFMKELRAVGAFTDPQEFDEKATEVFDKYGLVVPSDKLPTLRKSEESLSFFLDEFEKEFKADFVAPATESDQTTMTQLVSMLDRGDIYAAENLYDQLGTSKARAEAGGLIEKAKLGETAMNSGPIGEFLTSIDKRVSAAAGSFSSAGKDEFIAGASEIVSEAKARLRAAIKGSDDLSPEGIKSNQEIQSILEGLDGAIGVYRQNKSDERSAAIEAVTEEVMSSTLLEGGTSKMTVQDIHKKLVDSGLVDARDPIIKELNDTIRRGTEAGMYFSRLVESQYSGFVKQLADSEMMDDPTTEQLAQIRDIIAEGVRKRLLEVSKEQQPTLTPSDYWSNGENQQSFNNNVDSQLEAVFAEATQALLVSPKQPEEKPETVTGQIEKAKSQQELIDSTLQKSQAAAAAEASLTEFGNSYFNDGDEAWNILSPDDYATVNGVVQPAFESLDFWELGSFYQEMFAGPAVRKGRDGYDPLIDQFKKSAKFEPYFQYPNPASYFVPQEGYVTPTVAIPLEALDEAVEGLTPGLGELPKHHYISGTRDTGAVGISDYFEMSAPNPPKLENESLITTRFYSAGEEAVRNPRTAYAENREKSRQSMPERDPWAFSDRLIMLRIEQEYLDDDEKDSGTVIRTLAYGHGMLTSKGFPVEWVINGGGEIVLSATREAVVGATSEANANVLQLQDANNDDYSIAALNGATVRPIIRTRSVAFTMDQLPEYDPTKFRIGSYDQIQRFFAENTDPRTGAFYKNSPGAKWLEASNKLGRKESPLPNTPATVKALHLQQVLLARPWTNTREIDVERRRLQSELENLQKGIGEQQ